jgi:hypothetical protein
MPLLACKALFAAACRLGDMLHRFSKRQLGEYTCTHAWQTHARSRAQHMEMHAWCSTHA